MAHVEKKARMEISENSGKTSDDFDGSVEGGDSMQSFEANEDLNRPGYKNLYRRLVDSVCNLMQLCFVQSSKLQKFLFESEKHIYIYIELNINIECSYFIMVVHKQKLIVKFTEFLQNKSSII